MLEQGLLQEPFPNYATWPYEMALPPVSSPWDGEEAARALKARLKHAKNAHELHVSYYRIGYKLAFPLPLRERPIMPTQVPGISDYPWFIWLTWCLEERWRILHFAWRQWNDTDAGLLLQQELAALAEWGNLRETANRVHLASAHLAAVLALAIADSKGWETTCLVSAKKAASKLFTKDLWNWYLASWPSNTSFSLRQLHNIPLITLCRSAQLARVLGDERASAIDTTIRGALSAWAELRTGGANQAEGTAYDGFFADSLTEYLISDGCYEPLWQILEAPFETCRKQWISLSLPGRCDLHAPLGDVEPEMTFWATALLRMAHYYGWNDARWFVHHVPLSRLPGAALAEAVQHPFEAGASNLNTGVEEHTGAVSIRSGWKGDDCLVAIGLSRSQMGHLHNDGGSLIIGWNGRFWITDPGYQQYVRGAERDYSIGVQAHNAPVIGGESQQRQAAVLETLEDRAGYQHVALDLTACYHDLPAEAGVKRNIWLLTETAKVIVVRDELTGLSLGKDISFNWLGGTGLAWGFSDGVALLSNGNEAVWLGCYPQPCHPDQLTRHIGTRGPLTLSQRDTISSDPYLRWTFFVLDDKPGWQPPKVDVRGRQLTIELPDGSVVAVK